MLQECNQSCLIPYKNIASWTCYRNQPSQDFTGKLQTEYWRKIYYFGLELVYTLIRVSSVVNDFELILFVIIKLSGKYWIPNCEVIEWKVQFFFSSICLKFDILVLNYFLRIDHFWFKWENTKPSNKPQSTLKVITLEIFKYFHHLKLPVDLKWQ